MANEQNLIPVQSEKEARALGQKGGIASGKARREKKMRGDILREIVNTEVTNEEMLAKMRELGITDEHPTLEKYINTVATKDLTKKANIADLQKMNEELYGPFDKKAQVELSGEVSGVTINIKRYDGEKDGE